MQPPGHLRRRQRAKQFDTRAVKRLRALGATGAHLELTEGRQDRRLADHIADRRERLPGLVQRLAGRTEIAHFLLGRGEVQPSQRHRALIAVARAGTHGQDLLQQGHRLAVVAPDQGEVGIALDGRRLPCHVMRAMVQPLRLPEEFRARADTG